MGGNSDVNTFAKFCYLQILIGLFAQNVKPKNVQFFDNKSSSEEFLN